jgi:hypothetical protein
VVYSSILRQAESIGGSEKNMWVKFYSECYIDRIFVLSVVVFLFLVKWAKYLKKMFLWISHLWGLHRWCNRLHILTLNLIIYSDEMLLWITHFLYIRRWCVRGHILPTKWAKYCNTSLVWVVYLLYVHRSFDCRSILPTNWAIDWHKILLSIIHYLVFIDYVIISIS